MADQSQTGAGNAPAAADPSDTSEAIVSTDQVSDLQRERDDYYDRWVRKTAEFENYRKRIERERREQSDQAIIGFLLELLSVADDFDRALTVDAGEGGARLSFVDADILFDPKAVYKK